MPAAKLSKINLLPKNIFEFSSLGKILKWSLTTGRVLVVLTEFVVILAFGSRFYYDKRLNDLTEEIDQKLAVVESYNDVETKARLVLAKQQVVSSFLKNNLSLSTKINQIKRITPQDVTFSEILIDQKGINLSGKSSSEEGLANLLIGINSLPNIESVNIGGVDFDQKQGVINFKVIVNLAVPKS